MKITYQEVYDAFYEISAKNTVAEKREYAIIMAQAFLDEIHASRMRKNIKPEKAFKETV